MLKLRRKTAAVLAGTTIGIACLWGIASWQEISPRQLFNLFLGSLLFILGIMILALLLMLLVHGARKLAAAMGRRDSDEDGGN